MFSNETVLTIVNAAEQSVHPTSGTLRDLQAFFSLWVYTRLKPSPRPAHLRVTQTVGAPSEAWRFSQGESPCRTRPNQPFVPSVAVMKEAAKVG